MPVIIKTDMPEGNAYAIMGNVANILQKIHGHEKAQPIIEEYHEQATSGDYENLKKVSLQFVNQLNMPPLLVFTTSDNVSENIIDEDEAESDGWDGEDDGECEECGWLLEDCEC